MNDIYVVMRVMTTVYGDTLTIPLDAYSLLEDNE